MFNKAIKDIMLCHRCTICCHGTWWHSQTSGASWWIRWKFWLLASARFPRRYCQCHAPYGPLCENMTSSTKPEVHNVLHCHQRRTEPRPQVTCIQKIMWSLDVLFEICEHRDRHTDTLIAIPHTPAGRWSNCKWIRGTGILISGNFSVSQWYSSDVLDILEISVLFACCKVIDTYHCELKGISRCPCRPSSVVSFSKPTCLKDWEVWFCVVFPQTS